MISISREWKPSRRPPVANTSLHSSLPYLSSTSQRQHPNNNPTTRPVMPLASPLHHLHPTLTRSALRPFLQKLSCPNPTFTLFISSNVHASTPLSSRSQSNQLSLPGSLRPPGDIVQDSNNPPYIRATSSLLSIERSIFNSSGNKSLVYIPLVTAAASSSSSHKSSICELLPTFAEV